MYIHIIHKISKKHYTVWVIRIHADTKNKYGKCHMETSVKILDFANK